MKRFDTVLIANRGAIAQRIARTCKELGLRTIMVYSPRDCHPELLQLADHCLEIPDLAEQSAYLNQAAILAIAKDFQAAIHPGYGFLSERADFAQACLDAGLIWIGPDPDVLALCGNKARCNQLMQQQQLPLLSSVMCHDTKDIAKMEALGFPILLKPSQGGGGIGMRLVQQAAELPRALEACLQLSQRFFGQQEVIAERFLDAARHIEVQVLADAWGTIRIVGERECSIQRRRQKVVEEAPTIALNPEQRQRLYELALQAAQAVGLNQVATIEFLWDGSHFWFLEINPRIQVEHAVTEMLTGFDLVEWQVRIAQGENLDGFVDPVPTGHAIEARLYAEHPWTGLPAAGDIYHLNLPTGHGLRIESGVYQGMKLSSAFDPLLMKVIAHGPNRERARLRLLQALQSLELSGSEGLATNQPALVAILQSPEFISGAYHTGFLETFKALDESVSPETALLLTHLQAQQRQPLQQSHASEFWRPSFCH